MEELKACPFCGMTKQKFPVDYYGSGLQVNSDDEVFHPVGKDCVLDLNTSFLSDWNRRA
jgi:hypothetical protein